MTLRLSSLLWQSFHTIFPVLLAALSPDILPSPRLFLCLPQCSWLWKVWNRSGAYLIPFVLTFYLLTYTCEDVPIMIKLELEMNSVCVRGMLPRLDFWLYTYNPWHGLFHQCTSSWDSGVMSSQNSSFGKLMFYTFTKSQYFSLVKLNLIIRKEEKTTGLGQYLPI